MRPPKHKCLTHIVAELDATQKAHNILYVVYGCCENLAVPTEHFRMTLF